jgi:hypothetical protein
MRKPTAVERLAIEYKMKYHPQKVTPDERRRLFSIIKGGKNV